jgi:hypothetical protein
MKARSTPSPGDIVVAFENAGLAFDTKFDLNRSIELPWSDRWFKTPPTNAPAFGQKPKIGALRASMSKALLAAYGAARR